MNGKKMFSKILKYTPFKKIALLFLGSPTSGFKSCLEIKTSDPSAATGIYTIYSKYGSAYQTFCEMDTIGGGWTLVASIHENQMGNDGKCTFGDKWSSETGNHVRSGESNWENVNTFGRPEYATRDDYKNTG